MVAMQKDERIASLAMESNSKSGSTATCISFTHNKLVTIAMQHDGAIAVSC